MAFWVKDLVLSLLWLGFSPLAWELSHATGIAKKKKKLKVATSRDYHTREVSQKEKEKYHMKSLKCGI